MFAVAAPEVVLLLLLLRYLNEVVCITRNKGQNFFSSLPGLILGLTPIKQEHPSLILVVTVESGLEYTQ